MWSLNGVAQDTVVFYEHFIKFNQYESLLYTIICLCCNIPPQCFATLFVHTHARKQKSVRKALGSVQADRQSASRPRPDREQTAGRDTSVYDIIDTDVAPVIVHC